MNKPKKSGRVYLFIDVQNDYCDCSGFYAKRDKNEYDMNRTADRVVEFYQNLVSKGNGDNCIFFAIQYEDAGAPCMRGTWGAEIYKVSPPHLFFKKEFDCFSNEDFDPFLRKKNIEEIVVVGFQLSFCVFATVMTAVQKKYHVTVIRDLIGERRKHLYKVPYIYETFQNNGVEVEISEHFYK